jgi:hypothetical protein
MFNLDFQIKLIFIFRLLNKIKQIRQMIYDHQDYFQN